VNPNMPALSFKRLALELKAAGAANNTIARMLLELREHCEDAEADALGRGLSPGEARRQAEESLGSCDAIVAAVVARSNLLDWRHRWPHSARCVDSIACCLSLPAAPFVYCANHPAGLVRWGVSSGLGACITASMLLALQWLVL
jgi:hypothetical protein